MKNRIPFICDRLVEFSFYLLFFLVPLILTPWNYELFEFNKMLLTYFFTTIIVATWLIKMAVEKRLIFRRTILDIPLILFLGSQIISTIYSIDRHTSLWGYYSRCNGGLFSTISYLLLYWAYVSNMDKEKALQTIRYILYTTTLVALYGIAEHFGIDAEFWVQLVQERVFSTLGQPNWLAAWLVALIPLTWALVLSGKEKLFKKRLLPFVGYGLLAIFYLCLLYTKSRSGLFGLAVAYAAFWGLIGLTNLKRLKKLIKPFVIINLILVILTAIVGTPWTPQASQLINKFRPQPTPKPEEATISAESEPVPFVSESGDIRKIVWQGAIQIWKDYPIFGTGVETFGYSYYWHRPRAHNDVSEWDLLYNKAHNEYLTILANTGLVGLITYLGLIGAFIIWVLKRGIKSRLIIALFAGYVSILVTNFFGFSVVAVNLLFFLIPATAMVLVEKEKEEKAKAMEIKTRQKIAIIIILILGLSTIIYLAKFWYADTRFAVAEKLNDTAWYERAYNELQTAINLHPGEPYYYSELSLSLAGLAKLADEANDASLSAQFAEMAVNESDEALKISPYHLNFWKKRAKMFISLTELDSQYQQNALDTLLYAAELAPTDAKVFYNLGLLYSQIGQMETAIKTMEHAVELKPNYNNARYALALFYEEGGKIKETREQLEYILEKINPTDTRAKNKLEEL